MSKTVNENRLRKYSSSKAQSSESATAGIRVTPNLEGRTSTMLVANTNCGRYTVKW